MTWEQGVAIATLFISVASLIWNICNSRKIHKNNLELENVKSYYQLKQSKYALEFKAYEELSMLLAKMVGDTGAFILAFTSTEDVSVDKEKREEFFNKVAKDTMEFVNKLKGYEPFIPSDIYEKFYDMRDLCSKGMKFFFPLEDEELTAQKRKELKSHALQTKNELIEKHKKFNNDLASLIRARIAETKES